MGKDGGKEGAVSSSVGPPPDAKAKLPWGDHPTHLKHTRPRFPWLGHSQCRDFHQINFSALGHALSLKKDLMCKTFPTGFARAPLPVSFFK